MRGWSWEHHNSDLQSLENESRKKCIQGVAIKKHDRRWLISLEDDTDPFFVTMEDLMNDRKYYVVENNSENRLNGAGARKQSLKKRRQRLREEMKSEQAAKKIADEKRQEWLKEEYHAIKKAFSTDCENYKLSDFLTFCKKVLKPFTTTVGDHCVAVGGCNKFACVRKITRDIISDCISTKTNQTLRNEPPAKRKWTETRIENTFCSSEGHSAELCMTVKYNKLDEETKKKNIQKLREKKEGIKKVLAFFHQRKIAFDTVNLPCTEVRTAPTNFSATGSTADNENAESVHLSSTINYGGSSNNWWCVSDSLTDVVLQMFFKLFYLPSGGGHLNKTKAAKMVVP